MSVKLFIGGLSWSTNDESLRAKFEEFGALEDAVVVKDRETGRSRGFGFVTYSTSEAADEALNAMNDKEFEGRTIRVDRASERSGESRPRGGGSVGGYRSGGNGGGYGGGRTSGGYGAGNGGARSYGSREGGSYGGGERSYGGGSREAGSGGYGGGERRRNDY